jgi:2',3'-cyclic-nucleotide 2'-phosphodiesterase (5'-nucleotidase family)
MDAEIAVVASGHFRGAIQAGTLTFGDLDKACISSANPFLSNVTGKQLWEALESGLDPDLNQVKHHGLRGSPVGIPQISGMVVEFDPDEKPNQRIRQVYIQGQALNLDKSYRVAHTDFESFPEIGYLEIEDKQTISVEVPTILGEVLADYVREHSPLSEPARGRWVEVAHRR